MTLTLCRLLFAAQISVGLPSSPLITAVPEPVEIVLFSDFQCPYCARFAMAFRELQTKGVDRVKTTVTFKHFPLTIHPKALQAHYAAVAAGEQGKFWEMHDVLFAHPRKVQRSDLLAYAVDLGLDADRFGRDLDSDRTRQVVAADKAEGERLGVAATPGFFVNGKGYSGTRSFDQLKEIVLAAPPRLGEAGNIPDASLSAGNPESAVTVQLFIDLQSPLTRTVLTVMNDLMRRYPSTVRLQFRNFPLSFHPQAGLAHEAAMAAAREGQFWKFANQVIDRRDPLHESDLIEMATQMGLDAASFAEALRQHRYAARVEADVQAASRRGIRGSPAVLVNGRRIDGVPKLETMIEYVEAESARQHMAQVKKP